MCQDKEYSDELVAHGQAYCDEVYDKEEELTPDKQQNLTAVLYKALMYKVGQLDMSLYFNCCVTRFESS